MKPIEVPIDGVLDLHTFNPKELPDLLDDYLSACHEKGIFAVRVIHGKGTGMQKARVRSLLAKHPLVGGFADAPPEAGGWGATLVSLVGK
ncbi:Smr/MutS family protein [Desulfatitalea alkaliphila]|uniref:Smr/MutS family protein n=1 Tax=Desulfatitalea alkaliphila TaxID=2929485 RepID=A0AA41UL42_9BACT|nr:Smr/MutS family protein [Desulfatitalea alkaliphila]MCJ8501091.1 Smr/MutS family protein [Desulfatitalea alkaliphila]